MVNNHLIRHWEYPLGSHDFQEGHYLPILIVFVAGWFSHIFFSWKCYLAVAVLCGLKTHILHLKTHGFREKSGKKYSMKTFILKKRVPTLTVFRR